MDCSPPGSSVHGISRERLLEWVAIPFSRGSSQPRDWTRVSCIAGRFFTVWATREALVVESLLLFSHSVMYDSLRPHGLQHPRLPCRSPSPGTCSNSLPLSWSCRPTISSSVFPFSSCLQCFPASGFFQISQFFTSGGQAIGASASHQSFQWIFRTDFL